MATASASAASGPGAAAKPSNARTMYCTCAFSARPVPTTASFTARLAYSRTGSPAPTAALRVTRSAIEDAPVLGGIARDLGLGWAVASFLAPTAISFAAFALLYWLVPARHVRLRHVWPGALVAAVLFETVKLAFGVYIQSFTRYDLVFGSLGAVVTFLFLMFVSANVLLLGAELAAQYPRVLRGDYDDPDREPERTRDAIRRLLRGLFFQDEDERRDAGRDG